MFLYRIYMERNLLGTGKIPAFGLESWTCRFLTMFLYRIYMERKLLGTGQIPAFGLES